MKTLHETTTGANATLAAVKAVIRLTLDERLALLRILRDELPELWAEVAREGA
jgi:hypothetical protein